MKKIVRINNLNEKEETKDYQSLALEIAELVNANIDYSNKGTYDEASLKKLKGNKTVSNILELINGSFVICIYEEDILVACGFVTLQDERYFSKSLHVHPAHRDKGLGRIICNEREKVLVRMGVEELYIESMKFPETLNFHRRNGFKTEKAYKELKNTVLMKKKLR